MFENYFDELDPVKRKEILDGLLAESENGSPDGSDAGELSSPEAKQQLGQIQRLFAARYELNKKGEYNDHFVGALSQLLEVARNSGGRLTEKRNTNLVAEAVRTLCLDRGDEFSDDILYREMCQLIALYISICNEDTLYQSAFLGMGRMNSKNIREKIRSDLNLFWETIETFLGDLPDFRVFKKAIEDTMQKKLG